MIVCVDLLLRESQVNVICKIGVREVESMYEMPGHIVSKMVYQVIRQVSSKLTDLLVFMTVRHRFFCLPMSAT